MLTDTVGFFDVSKRYTGLDGKAAPLVKLNAMAQSYIGLPGHFLSSLPVSGIRVIYTGRKTDAKAEEHRKFIMSVQDRIRKYRTHGGAAGFVRVEVLVPPAGRERVRIYAQQLRENHRAAEEELNAMCRDAIARFGVRVLDNIDPDRIPTAQQRARVVGRALMDKGGLAGFKLGRQLVKQAEALDGVERAPGEDYADTGTEPL